MICKSLGINYHSPHLEKSNFHQDAIMLNDLYLQLKQIVGEIIEIADKHSDEDVAKSLWRDVMLIEGVDHDLTNLAKLMDKEDKV